MKLRRHLLRSCLLVLAFVLTGGMAGTARGQVSPGDRHTFTGPNGQTLEAEVLDLREGQVMIRRLSDGQSFALAANRLAPQDVEFMRAWLAAREASKHPLGWKRVRIHLPEAADGVEAPGIPSAFRRIGGHRWEAELPEGAWILVKLWREGGGDFAPQFLLPYDGEREWYLTFEENRLHLAIEPAGPVRQVGVAVSAADDEAALRSMKSEFPAEGIALHAGFFDAADVTALRGAKLTSLVVGKLPDYAVAREGKVRALRITETIADAAGLEGCDALEFFQVPASGEFPMTALGELENLRTVVDRSVHVSRVQLAVSEITGCDDANARELPPSDGYELIDRQHARLGPSRSSFAKWRV